MVDWGGFVPPEGFYMLTGRVYPRRSDVILPVNHEDALKWGAANEWDDVSRRFLMKNLPQGLGADDLKSAGVNHFRGAPVCVEHDLQRQIGRVVDTQYSPDGSLWMLAVIDKVLASGIWGDVRSGAMRGLSVQFVFGSDGAKRAVEVSVVRTPLNPECQISVAANKEGREIKRWRGEWQVTMSESENKYAQLGKQKQRKEWEAAIMASKNVPVTEQEASVWASEHDDDAVVFKLREDAIAGRKNMVEAFKDKDAEWQVKLEASEKSREKAEQRILDLENQLQKQEEQTNKEIDTMKKRVQQEAVQASATATKGMSSEPPKSNLPKNGAEYVRAMRELMRKCYV